MQGNIWTDRFWLVKIALNYQKCNRSLVIFSRKKKVYNLNLLCLEIGAHFLCFFFFSYSFSELLIIRTSSLFASASISLHKGLYPPSQNQLQRSHYVQHWVYIYQGQIQYLHQRQLKYLHHEQPCCCYLRYLIYCTQRQGWLCVCGLHFRFRCIIKF